MDDGIVMMLQAAARRLVWLQPVVLAKWEADSYAHSHVTDELRRLYHADDNFQQLNDAAERLVLKTLTLEEECNTNLAGEYTSAYIRKHAAKPAWTVIKPKRFQGYSMALYLLLEEAYVAGKPKPTAHDVLSSFKANKPDQIAKVIEGEGFDFYTKTGNTKHASLATIAERIRNMTS